MPRSQLLFLALSLVLYSACGGKEDPKIGDSDTGSPNNTTPDTGNNTQPDIGDTPTPDMGSTPDVGGSEDVGNTTDTGTPADMGTDAGGCAAGFQDNDGDGMCTPGCDATGADAIDCSPGGTCDDTTGARFCDCDPGYISDTGDTCETCARGYEPAAGGTCVLNEPPGMNRSLWLDADAPGTMTVGGTDNLSRWASQSGTFELTQTTGANQPTRIDNARNGRAAIRFDGDDFLSVGNYFGLAVDTYEIIVALKASPTGTPGGLIGATAGGATNWAVKLEQHQDTDYRFTHRSTPGLTGGDQVVADRSGSLGAGWVAATFGVGGGLNTMAIWASDSPTNATAVSNITTNAGVGQSMTLNLGFSQGTYWDGEIYEVLIYTRRLTVAEREEVTDYLDAKWGLR